jgi:hypothetical protein
VAQGIAFYPTRDGTVHVIELGNTPKTLAKNKFTDGGQVISTPAISDGELFLRSSKSLYCIAPVEK